MAAYWRRQNLCKICFTFILPLSLLTRDIKANSFSEETVLVFCIGRCEFEFRLGHQRSWLQDSFSLSNVKMTPLFCV
jgi:hypothetical protein